MAGKGRLFLAIIIFLPSKYKFLHHNFFRHCLYYIHFFTPNIRFPFSAGKACRLFVDVKPIIFHRKTFFFLLLCWQIFSFHVRLIIVWHYLWQMPVIPKTNCSCLVYTSFSRPILGNYSIGSLIWSKPYIHSSGCLLFWGKMIIYSLFWMNFRLFIFIHPILQLFLLFWKGDFYLNSA